MSLNLFPESDTALAAVQNYWNAETQLLTLAGPLFTSEVAESLNGAAVVPPYTSVRLEKTSYEYTFEATYFEFSRLSFCCYALGATAAEKAATAIIRYFSWCSLPFQSVNANTVYVRLTDYEVQSTSIRYQDDSIVYQAELGFDVCIQRY